VATKFPSKKKKQFGVHEVALHGLTWNNMVATKSPSENKKTWWPLSCPS
jgi:hypothetical protein